MVTLENQISLSKIGLVGTSKPQNVLGAVGELATLSG